MLISVESADEGREIATHLHDRLTTVLRDMAQPATFSMGAVIAFPDADSRRAELMHDADRAMYRAKKQDKGGLHVEVVDRVRHRPALRRASHLEHRRIAPA